MIFTCSFKRLDFSSSLAQYAQDRLDKIGKFQTAEIKAHLTFSKQGHMKSVDISLRLPNMSYRAHAESDDFYTSVDRAVAKLVSQIKKRRGRLKSHKNYHVAADDESQDQSFNQDDFLESA